MNDKMRMTTKFSMEFCRSLSLFVWLAVAKNVRFRLGDKMKRLREKIAHLNEILGKSPIFCTYQYTL